MNDAIEIARTLHDLGFASSAKHMMRIAQVENEPFSNEYTIWEMRLPRLQNLIAELEKIAIKVGVAPPSIQVLGETIVEQKDGPKRMIKIRLDGETPRMPGGWKLLGVVDNIAPGSNIVRNIPGQEVPQEFYTSEQRCDFCGQNRQRLVTYIIEDENGNVKCVGSNCVKQALGWYKDPAAVAMFLDRIGSMTDMFEEQSGRGSFEEGEERSGGIGMLDFLANAAAVIRLNGFVSKARAEESNGVSTVDATTYNMSNKPDKIEPSEEDVTMARNVLEWLQTLDRDWAGSDGYKNNIVSLKEVVSPKNQHLGLIASLIPLYKREGKLKGQQQEIPMDSPFIGSIGERVKMRVFIESSEERQGRNGYYTLSKMRDKDGRVITSFASAPIEEGKFYEFDASISKQDTFNRIPQTTIAKISNVVEIPSFEENPTPQEAGIQDPNTSPYVGEVGQRASLTLTVDRVIEYEKPSFSYYGSNVGYIVKMFDEQGRNVVWRTSSFPSIENGDQVRMMARIEEHGMYQGEPQTSISRPTKIQRYSDDPVKKQEIEKVDLLSIFFDTYGEQIRGASAYDPNVSVDDYKQTIYQYVIDDLKNKSPESFDQAFDRAFKMMKKMKITFPSKEQIIEMRGIPQVPMVPQNPQAPMDPQDPNSIAAIKKRLIKLATKLDARNLHDLADELEFLI